MEFSFFSMVANASLVAKFVLLILFVMSVGSWGLMIQKAILLSSAQRKAAKGSSSFEKAAICARRSSCSAPIQHLRSTL